MNNPIVLPRVLINRILQHAQSDTEHEVCGLIARTKNGDFSCHPIDNIASTPDCLFQMDGKQQIDAMRNMREQNAELFAIYHSHPHTAAAPSATDLLQANYTDALYIIVSLQQEGVLDLRGFFLRNNQVTIASIEVT
ncbi:MAG: M67 family metallopeptidase [Gammaproteobacteria bacterium]|nr:M67 family metallopeptidase [Gammaproteobacteria bacterium]MDH5729066.1 M67 family metallopeptidase [Gammaproteobacteria bacterium]